MEGIGGRDGAGCTRESQTVHFVPSLVIVLYSDFLDLRFIALMISSTDAGVLGKVGAEVEETGGLTVTRLFFSNAASSTLIVLVQL